MSTRRRAFGSINQRGNSIRITYPGCRGGETLPGGSTVKDAEKLLARRRREIETGTFIAPDQATVGSFFADWMEVREREGMIPGTLRHYRVCLRRLTPIIGTVLLQALTRAHVEKTRDWLKAGGLSPKSVNESLNAGRAACNYALDHELIQRNPFLAVKRLPKRHYEAHPLNPEQAQRYLDVALSDAILQPYGRFLAVALLTLKRKGEVAAFQWKDVDLDAKPGSVRISGIMQPDGTIRREGSSKLKHATIRLLPQVVSLLREQWSWQRAVCGVVDANGTIDLTKQREQPDWLVWTNSVGDRISFTSLHEAHKRILKLAGLPDSVRIHDLRHTGVSLLISKGADVKKIQTLCGHSTIQMTLNVYGHLFPDDVMSTLELLGNSLNIRTREAV